MQAIQTNPPEPKKGRGRPRKPKAALPTAAEPAAVEPPPMMQLKEEPASNYTELVHLDGRVDLSDICIKEPVEAPAEPEQPPPSPVAFNSCEPQMNFSALPAAVEPEEEPESEEDKAERRALVLKIKKYRETFLIVQKIEFNPNGPLVHLRGCLDETRSVIQNKNTGLMIKKAYLTGVNCMEMIGEKTKKLKLTGLTQLLGQSEEAKSILDEIACEMTLGAYKRLLFVTASTAFVVDSINRRSAVFEDFKKEPVKEEVVQKYADL